MINPVALTPPVQPLSDNHLQPCRPSGHVCSPTPESRSLSKTNTSPTSLHPGCPKTIKGEGFGQLHQTQPPSESAATIPPQASQESEQKTPCQGRRKGEERHTATTGTPCAGDGQLNHVAPTQILALTDERPPTAARPPKKDG